ncbi:hypothetical protein MIS45_03800 [Wielerella bovis]|uniref:hypothetical protein n=1 Tax=Wielerella bovis TaxID=2917790 RepID=UPI00201A0105|nr:hypothetical protein [Wielerella bovis]ULJ69969.1 hypothetical protein MIS45_03800 [Wielerella bovis]
MSDSLAYIVPQVVYLENAQEKIDQIHAQFLARGWIEDELAVPLFEKNAVAYALTEKGIEYFTAEAGCSESKSQDSFIEFHVLANSWIENKFESFFKENAVALTEEGIENFADEADCSEPQSQYSTIEFHVFDEPKAYGFAEGSEFDETDCPHCQAHYYCDYDGFDEEDEEGESSTEQAKEPNRLQFIDLLDTLDTNTGKFTCLQCGQSELISRFTYQYGNVFACSNVAVAFAGIGTDMIPPAVKQEIQEILGVECSLVDERI